MPRPFASGVVLKGGTSTMAGRSCGLRQYPRVRPGVERGVCGWWLVLARCWVLRERAMSPELQVTTAPTGAAPTGVGSSRGVSASRGGW